MMTKITTAIAFLGVIAGGYLIHDPFSPGFERYLTGALLLAGTIPLLLLGLARIYLQIYVKKKYAPDQVAIKTGNLLLVFAAAVGFFAFAGVSFAVYVVSIAEDYMGLGYWLYLSHHVAYLASIILSAYALVRLGTAVYQRIRRQSRLGWEFYLGLMFIVLTGITIAAAFNTDLMNLESGPHFGNI